MSEKPIDQVPLIMPPGQDVTPETESDALTCGVCGKELIYKGTGRKPKYCPTHRQVAFQQAKKKTASLSESMPRGEKATGNAAKAATVLATYNGVAGIGLHYAGFPKTAEALVDSNKIFEEQVAVALAGDEKLAKRILGSGQMSAAAGIAIAYAVLGVNVFTTFKLEQEAKKNARHDGTES